jgi:hypothetical protein
MHPFAIQLDVNDHKPLLLNGLAFLSSKQHVDYTNTVVFIVPVDVLCHRVLDEIIAVVIVSNADTAVSVC